MASRQRRIGSEGVDAGWGVPVGARGCVRSGVRISLISMLENEIAQTMLVVGAEEGHYAPGADSFYDLRAEILSRHSVAC
jgi:hypothetical protein